MKGTLVEIVQCAVANDVREFDVTDDDGQVTTVTLGEPVRTRPTDESLTISVGTVIEA